VLFGAAARAVRSQEVVRPGGDLQKFGLGQGPEVEGSAHGEQLDIYDSASTTMRSLSANVTVSDFFGLITTP
jgi:hypothetical protein